MTSKSVPNVRERLMEAATDLFVEKGYDGASVRDICAKAGTSSRMIHHYFGSKEALYLEILDGFGENFLAVPIRILADPPTSQAEFVAKFEIFVSETLEAILAQAQLFELIVRERIDVPVFVEYYLAFENFLNAGQSLGVLRAEVSANLLTGMVLDRVGNQVRFAPAILRLTGSNVFTDVDYKRRWIKSSVDLVLYGLLLRTELPANLKNSTLKPALDPCKAQTFSISSEGQRHLRPDQMQNVVLIIHLILALGLIAIVLLQRSEGGGLGMGGGGGAGGGLASSRSSATLLGKMTWILAIAFIITSLTLTIFAASNSANNSVIDQIGGTTPVEAPAIELPTLDLPATEDTAPRAD